MSAAQIKQSLAAILTFMQPHWEFVNCHMVSYLTDNHWQQHVPLPLQLEVQQVGQVRKCIEELFWQQGDENLTTGAFTEFHTFLNQTKQFRLENCAGILTNITELQALLRSATEKTNISIKEFLSEKKRHEVEITAELVNDLVKSYAEAEPLFVVDAGDGKGYLSSRLALQYEHKVLGIDCNETNTENALERSKKLQRAWNGLTERAQLEQIGIKPPRRGKKQKHSTKTENLSGHKKLANYKTTSRFITKNLNISHLLKDFFLLADSDTSPAYCLTGLHTCGNLASTCLNVFHIQAECKMVCNIGCCYHLLKEAYSENEFFGNKAIMDRTSDIGFPMSQFLQAKHIRLGRNARMLAAQSIERTLVAKELPNISLFYRALLEVLICEQDSTLKDTIQVGKIRKFQNFTEYVKLCCDNSANLDYKTFSSDHIERIEFSYGNAREYLDLFYLLRMSFAPILECLILLDRLLYLKELGYEQSYLVSVFDAVISPRHFGIVAIK